MCILSGSKLCVVYPKCRPLFLSKGCVFWAENVSEDAHKAYAGTAQALYCHRHACVEKLIKVLSNFREHTIHLCIYTLTTAAHEGIWEAKGMHKDGGGKSTWQIMFDFQSSVLALIDSPSFCVSGFLFLFLPPLTQNLQEAVFCFIQLLRKMSWVLSAGICW